MAQVEFAGTKGLTASMESGTFKILAPGVNVKARGLHKIAVKEELKGEVVYGNGPGPIGYTIGEYIASCDVEQIMTEHMWMTQNMRSLGVSAFSITATWREGRVLQRIEIPEVVIKTRETSVERGGGVVMVSYSVQVMSYIKWNGTTLLDEKLINTPSGITLNR